MSWRRGELWLSGDVAWFGENAGAAVLGLPPLPSFRLDSPPGLLASRLRRAAWKRRRHARRAKATALALSPAVAVALATLRSSSDPQTSLAAEDPPSLTFRLVGSTVELGERPARFGAAYASTSLARPERRASTARPVQIHWHDATSVGLPWNGHLVDGTQLPVTGPNWVSWDPVTSTVPNQPVRLYGNQRTIHAIVAVTAAYRAAHPHAPRVVVGDISREGVGPMTDEHVSHQNGLDVDIYLPRLDHRLSAPTETGQIDYPLAQDLVNRFVAAGAQMIFVGIGSPLHGPGGVVIPYPNHEYHMHVRFPPPAAR
jgi:Penicillin-insensitive murein endopeptidase